MDSVSIIGKAPREIASHLQEYSQEQLDTLDADTQDQVAFCYYQDLDQTQINCGPFVGEGEEDHFALLSRLNKIRRAALLLTATTTEDLTGRYAQKRHQVRPLDVTFETFPLMEKLDLEVCRSQRISRLDFSALTRLKTLHLWEATLTNPDYRLQQEVFESAIRSLKECSDLKCLGLANREFADFSLITSHLPLRHLKLMNCSFPFEELSKAFTRTPLESLDLAGANHFEYQRGCCAFLGQLISHEERRSVLDAQKIEHIVTLIRDGNLKKLSLKGYAITHQAMAELIKAINACEGFKGLGLEDIVFQKGKDEAVDFSQCRFESPCTLKLLEFLSISEECEGQEEKDPLLFEELLESATSLKDLQRLNLGCFELGRKATILERILTACPNLAVLSVLTEFLTLTSLTRLTQLAKQANAHASLTEMAIACENPFHCIEEEGQERVDQLVDWVRTPVTKDINLFVLASFEDPKLAQPLLKAMEEHPSRVGLTANYESETNVWSGLEVYDLSKAEDRTKFAELEE